MQHLQHLEHLALQPNSPPPKHRLRTACVPRIYFSCIACGPDVDVALILAVVLVVDEIEAIEHEHS